MCFQRGDFCLEPLPSVAPALAESCVSAGILSFLFDKREEKSSTCDWGE